MAPRLCRRRRLSCLIAMVTAAVLLLLLQAFSLLQVLVTSPHDLIIKSLEIQRTIHVAVSPQVPQHDTDCCSTPLHTTRLWRPRHGESSTSHTHPVSITRASAERTANTSSGVNNASSGVKIASARKSNASSGVNNASAGMSKASPGVISASVEVINTSVGVTNASDIWQRRRVAVARGVCGSAGRQIAGRVEKVYVLETQRVAYCSTHKVASTFWLRVYRWLYNDTRTGHVASPLNISKLDAHLLPLRILKMRNLTKHLPEDQALTDGSYRFLFTRDPYARLWSVYIDKFVLPDNYFWSFYTRRIKAAVQAGSAKHKQGPQSDGAQDYKDTPWWRQLNLTSAHNGQKLSSGGGQGVKSDVTNSAAGRGVKSDVTNSAAGRGLRSEVHLPGDVQRQVWPAPRGVDSALCPEVTFREFLLYIVVQAARAGGQTLDDHFRPVHYGCNPCLFRPDFIGHMETMRQDSANVLRRMGLDKTLPELSANHVQQEVDMLVSFNFDLVVKKRLQRRCVSDRDLERRLLTAFVYNGYLTPASAGRLESRLPMGQSAFREAVLSLHRQSAKAADDLKRQKERFKWEAFQQVPRDLLLAVQKVFHWDFELFGYDPFPPELFGSV